jgi:enoyl-CoA hydratase
VNEANNDDNVHVIVVTGAGRSFCSGYDLKQFSEQSPVGPNSINQDMPWDPTVDFKLMKGFTDDFFSLWRSYKPTIAKVRGHCVAGGSDIALCCDMIVMEDKGLIGYPPAR